MKNKLSIETYIDSFKNMYDFDNNDDFDNPVLKKIIQENIDEYNADKKPSAKEMADVVKDALYFIQYGDTTDADDLDKINHDFYDRFPNGR